MFNFIKKTFEPNVWYISILALAVFLFTPRFFEVGAETEKVWLAAKILRETGEFPMLSMGPLYYVYLQLFLFLEYPLSIKLEFFITHLLCYFFIFLMLKKYISPFLALLLIGVWMPYLAYIVSTKYIAGMGLLSLHFAMKKDSVFRKGYLPPYLLMASLCSLNFLFFGIGHFIGTIFEKVGKKESLTHFSLKGYTNILALSLKILMIFLIFMVMTFPSTRPDNNPQMTTNDYVPFPQDSHFRVAFFQYAHAQYLRRFIKSETSCKEDWSFTHQQSFGGAQTVWEAISNNPKFVLDNTLYNLRRAIGIPKVYVFGPTHAPFNRIWTLIGNLIILLGALGYFIYKWKSKEFATILSIILGTAALASVLLLIDVSFRFYMQLFPIGLLFFVNVDKGIGLIKNSRSFRGFGFLQKENLSKRWSEIVPFRIKEILVLGATITVLVLSTTSDGFPFNGGIQNHVRAIIQGKDWLVRASEKNKNKTTSIVRAHSNIFSRVSPEHKILTKEALSFKIFAKTNLDRVYDIHSLPCFKDETGQIEDLLESMDMIFISYTTSKQESSNWVSAVYKRYKLHVEPFLEKALTRNWTVEEIPHYGNVYTKSVQ